MNLSLRLLCGIFAAAVSLLLLSSCVEKDKKTETAASHEAAENVQHRTVIEPALLPNRFQRTGYMISEDKDTTSDISGSDASLEELQLKVGAKITTRQPIPLREAMKAIVKNKNMSLSWASDVNQDLLVDVDVNPNDNFYEAIDNILRQLDYFHEMEGSTMVIKYRETKQYHMAMPFIKQEYNAGVGGNSFGSDVRIDSKGNKFDIWENIQKNLDSLIATWSSSIITPTQESAAVAKDDKKDAAAAAKKAGGDEAVTPAPLSRRVSSTDSTYTIDRPIGLVTVHAPKSLQKRISDYFNTLEKELYKQITIEAKIIEVQLQDSSSLGINWNTLLKNLSFQGASLAGSSYYSKDRQDLDEKGRTFSNTHSDTRSDTTTDWNGTSSSGENNTTILSDSSDYTNTENSSLGLSGETDSNGFQTSGNDVDSDSLYAAASGSSSDQTITRTLSDALSMGTTGASTIATLITGGAANVATAGIAINNFSFDSFINALKSQGQTSILSNPKISVMNGQPALLSVGREVTFIKGIESTTEDQKTTFKVETEQLLSGVGLALSAVVKDNDEIVMNLVPITSELTEPIEYVTVGEGKVGLPVVNKREMSTTVKIKNGSMLVVGGLISETESKDGDFIHGTENIPYLKYLFGYEEKKKIKRELIILLRPRII
ncbi:Pilus (MSHA type) biogenesis protein MshL [Candidatus Electronema halotolerans]